MLGEVAPSAQAAGQVIVFEVFCGDLGKRTGPSEEKFAMCKKLVPTAHAHPVGGGIVPCQSVCHSPLVCCSYHFSAQTNTQTHR
jgi:hypothetical protein